MTDEISEAAKLRACELEHAHKADRVERIQPRLRQPHEIDWDGSDTIVVLARQIQAFSDAAKALADYVPQIARPFVEQELAAHNLEIREIAP